MPESTSCARGTRRKCLPLRLKSDGGFVLPEPTLVALRRIRRAPAARNLTGGGSVQRRGGGLQDVE